MTIKFQQGIYNFHPDENLKREYYISNHDQDNPKNVGVELDAIKNITLDGNGSDFIFSWTYAPNSAT